MTKSTSEAAETLVHYLKLLAERAGLELGPAEERELEDVIEAFRAADRAAYELHSLHP